MTANKLIPVCEPLYLGNEIAYVEDAVKSGWISSAGEYLNKFEKAFAEYCGAKHAIATTSGTTALHLALVAHGVGEGDEVIIPNFTMAAVLLSVLYCGATPVFVDATRDTWCIDVEQLKKKITKKTKAIIPVHIYGHPADMNEINLLAKDAGISVIEDAAESHGATYFGKRCGSLSDSACFSFYANKIITTGEGGMVVTSNDEIAEKCRYFKNLCFSLKGPRDYWHNDIGFNYRMTNVQAALGLAQVEHIDEFVRRRRANAAQYLEALSGIEGLTLPVEKPNMTNVYWMFGFVVDKNVFGCSRDELAVKLIEKGIQTRTFFRPLHRQKMLEARGISDLGSYPQSELLGEGGMYLPSGSGLTQTEIAFVANCVREIHQALRK